MDRVFISAITLAELRHGIERLDPGRRRHRLEAWLTNELPLRLEDRVLPIGAPIADAWGKMMARGEAAGRPIGVMDALIAGTAEVHGLALVTPNSSHFQPFFRPIFNPWTDK